MAEAALVARPEALRLPLPPSSPTPAVRVRDFGKRYGRMVADRGVSLEVAPGEIYGLIGPDGAGKSSLMKAVAGVMRYEEGVVEVLGVPLKTEADAERVKGRIGFMPQGLGLNLYPELSVAENITFFARLRLVPADQAAARMERLLAVTRLAPFRDRPMKNLSGGMKQKLGLACTLIHEPELVILDEPTTGVDPVSRRDFWDILDDLLRGDNAGRSMTALVSTAYMDEAARFTHLSLFHQGRVLAHGIPEELSRLTPGTVVAIRAPGQADAFARLKASFPQVEAMGRWLHAFVPDADPKAAESEIRRVLADVPLTELYTREPDLEDVFIALLQRQGDAPPTPALPAEEVPGNGGGKANVANGGTGVAAIEATELTRDFGHFRAADRVSFTVQPGELFGLLGANGAGKTTVIKMLTGILSPTGGEGPGTRLRVAGRDMRRAGDSIKRHIGYMSQAFSLYHDLTVRENLRLYAGIFNLDPAETRARAAWVVAMAGLAGRENSLAGGLPMGLRQRLALGCALLHRPRVLFLDEPTSGVDPIGRRQFWEILFRLSREEGVAVLVTTHYMGEAEHCDHLALMHAGRIVADATPDDLKRQVEAEAGALLEIDADRAVRARALLAESGFSETALFGRHVHLLSHEPERDAVRIPEILARGGVHTNEVVRRPLSIEDVFVYRITALERAEQAATAGTGVRR